MTDQKFSHIANVTFISACDNLAREFCDTLGISHRPDDCWWVSYGSVFAFQCGEMFTNAEDMMLAVEHRLTWEQWSEGQTYLLDADLFPDMDSDSDPQEVEITIKRKKNGY